MFRFLLDDIGAASLDDIRTRSHAFTRLVQLAFWSARSYQRLVDAAPHMRAIVRVTPRDPAALELLGRFYRYVFRTAEPGVDSAAIRTILLRIATPDGQEDIVNAAEELIEQGRAEGIAKGRAEGITKGRAEGMARAMDALRKAIVASLVARGVSLGAHARARVETCADVDTLQVWLGRAVTASREDDVFSADAC